MIEINTTSILVLARVADVLCSSPLWEQKAWLKADLSPVLVRTPTALTGLRLTHLQGESLVDKLGLSKHLRDEYKSQEANFDFLVI